jgi:hypothetical protein
MADTKCPNCGGELRPMASHDPLRLAKVMREQGVSAERAGAFSSRVQEKLDTHGRLLKCDQCRYMTREKGPASGQIQQAAR